MNSFLVGADLEKKQWCTNMSMNYAYGGMTNFYMPYGQTLNQISTELPSIDLITKKAEQDGGSSGYNIEQEVVV